ncbi:hypothetical protein A2960_03610 [Candidatus Gottesmanbacteria bacterium RIFCSPLOWO2_01_FULL_39_12b]|uniref:Peptidase S11 D-alanyl-D-alanine carboxypeptidase A N-terminal domain-containing protein n=1 Tax=Candidatus Gottesmanbacteria bacterium RIFCSPLOWO2_01_FULL_39_12b TaxID=1798388 RepID=A0A1F6ANZ6_9BACT|nr:MAG: hypothetical protein A2960_03610 [Candidatus Gottesmanbacteria bacterium RIFCSPLOWO2_01_FULL_39_12b]
MKPNKTITFHNLKKNGSRYFCWISFILLISLFPAPNTYTRTVSKTASIILPKSIDLSPPPSYPINQKGDEAPQVSALGVIIKDIPSGATIYVKNEKTKFSPASTTKIITALVALDTFKLDDIMTVKSVLNEGKTMGLQRGEKLAFESLLYGTLVHSANDAAFAIAENYPGGIEKFVVAMNEKAQKLNLFDTHFANPAGFDDQNNYTTASDLAKLALVGLSNKTFSKIVGTRAITVSDVSYTYFHDLKNVNELLGKVPGVSGVKTGLTQEGGEILVSEINKNSESILIVILKSSDRFGETIKLIDWVFSNFVWKNIRDITPTIR